MRYLPIGAIGALSLLLTACSGTGQLPTSPTSTTTPCAPAIGAVLQSDVQLQAALGIYTIALDPATLSGTVELAATRSGTANDDLYLLPIDNFLRPASLKITGITSTATTLDLSYTFSHPFAAPSNIDGTPTAANRADLGVAAALLILADQPSATGNTYFTDRVVNTDLIGNADFYWDPGALVDSTGFSANLFPVQMLVHEDGPDGNRLGLSNGGDPTGNFGNDGWTKAELSFAPDNWTGFGILHQGQTVANTLSISKTELDALGAFSFDVAVLAKYNDPRGGATSAEKRANRLPGDFPDASQFAYRMPHGAWDCSGIEFVDSSDPFVSGSFSSSDIAFRVLDWDARAIETSVGDLSGDTDVTTVAVGEAGVPTLAVSIPEVIGDTTAVSDYTLGAIDDDSAFGGDAGTDTGRPDDLLFFNEAIESSVTGPATGGFYTGLVRVTDPEVANITDPLFVVELDGNLAPLSTNIPVNETYQVFEVEAEVPVTNNGWGKGFVTTGSDEGEGLAIDSAGNIIVSGQWLTELNLGGTVYTAAGSDWSCFVAKFDPAGAFIWDRTFGSANIGIAEHAHAVAVDAADNIFVAGWFRGPCDFGGGPVTSVGFSTGYLAKYTPNNALVWVKRFDSSLAGTGTVETFDVKVDASGDVYVTGWFTANPLQFEGGPSITNGGSFDTFLAKFNGTTGVPTWARRMGGTGTEQGLGIGIDDANSRLYAAGSFNNSVDFGLGVESSAGSSDGYLACYSLTNTPLWVETFGGSQADWNYHVGVSPTGPVTGGFFRGTATLGSGVSTSNGDADFFAVKLNSSGAFQWNWKAGGTLGDFVRTVAVDRTTGDVYIGGDWNDTVNFGGGPRVEIPGGRDAVVVKLDAAGAYVWDTVLAGSSSEFVQRIALTANGDPVMTGKYAGAVDFDPSAASLIFDAGGSDDLYLWKLQKGTGLF